MSDFGYADILDLVPEQAVEFTFGGSTWDAARGDLAKSKTLGDGGLALTADLVLVVPLQQFTDASVTPPAEKDQITVANTVYTVGVVTTEPTGDIQVLALYDANKGV